MGILDNLKNKQPQTAKLQAAKPSAAKAPPKARSPYDGMKETPLTSRRARLSMGQHVLKVIQVRDGYLEPHAGGDFFFAVDFEVVESTDPETLVGSERGFMTTLGKFPEYFHRDVKGFLLAAINCTEEELSDDAPTDAAGESNPLAGQIVIADVTPGKKVDPKTGQPYPNVRFIPVPSEDKAA